MAGVMRKRWRATAVQDAVAPTSACCRSRLPGAILQFEFFRSRSFKGAGFLRGFGRRAGRFFNARGQVRTRRGGILPFAFGDLHRHINRQAHEAAILVNPAGMVQRLNLGGANFGQGLGAHGGAVGINRRDRHGPFHHHHDGGEQKAGDEEAGADGPDGAFVTFW